MAEKADVLQALLPLPSKTESVADDPTLHNPLQRMERLSTGWFGIIMEYEGVIVEDTFDLHSRAWRQVAQEMGLPQPLGQMLTRTKGIRNEAVVSNVLHWTHNPTTAKHISRRKEEVYEGLLGDVRPTEVEGSRPFLEAVRRQNIPVALACALPESKVTPGLAALNLSQHFDAIVTAEDSGAPEIEYSYMYAANQIQRPFPRCVVVGDSNRSVEAAHELGMKSVVVTGSSKPAWTFTGADLVVRSLSQLSFVNMKKLFGNEDLVEPPERETDPDELEAYASRL